MAGEDFETVLAADKIEGFQVVETDMGRIGFIIPGAKVGLFMPQFGHDKKESPWLQQRCQA